MAKYIDNALRDLALQEIKDTANKMVFLKDYTYGDNYTTVHVTNNIGEVATVTGDFTLAGSGSGRKVTVAAKTITGASASGATPDCHVALVDTINTTVLVVTKENSITEVFDGNTLDIPPFDITLPQSV
jgi:hypothetical protein